MIVSPTLSPTAAQSAAQLSTSAASGSSSFVAALASAAQPASGTNAVSNAHRSFRSGQLSIDMHADGQRINGVSYFDEAGQKLTTSGFWPQDILRQCERFNIPLSDLKGLGPQLDAAGVRYKPYEQYAGTGSNHGIDLDDLASGGMGTAYDWTQDPLVHLKGPAALGQLQADQALAQRLGLTPWAGPTQAAGSATQTTAVALAASGTSNLRNTTSPNAITVTPASAGPATPTTSALSALDELVRLLTQVKTSLQNTAALSPAALPAGAAPSTPSTVPFAVPATPPPEASAAQDTSTTQRLSQMKSLLEQLLAQR